MIVRKDKIYETNSMFLNVDWYKSGNYVIDETTEEGQVLAQKIMQHAPYYDFVLDENDVLIDIKPTERPPLPPAPSQPLTEEQQRLLDLELAMAQILGGGGV